MNKTLLILAASSYQLLTIATAKRLGYRVVTTDNVRDNPGHALADVSYDIDTTDSEAVLELARKENIAGVIAAGTDVAVMTAAYLADQLGTPGPSPEAAHILTNKHAFRKFLADAGLPYPRAFLVVENSVPEGMVFGDHRWLIKPTRSSGSKGIFIIADQAEYHARVAESRHFSIDGTAVLEEFLEGSQHTCEGVLRDGRIALSILTDRDTAPSPHTTTTGHRLPSHLPSELQERVIAAIEDIFERLGIVSGPFDCDFVVIRDLIVLIEITPRLGGNSLSRLFSYALGFDLVAYAVRHACGDPCPIQAQTPPRPSAIAILGADRAGRLTWNEDQFKALLAEDWVDTLLLDLPMGADVQPFINGRHRVGEALINGVDRNEVDAHLLDLRQRLNLAAI